MLSIAEQYPDLIDNTKFTFEVFMDAYVLSVTRAFGYSLPYLMLCPLADCANHHATDIQYELFNDVLTKKGQNCPDLTENEKNYFTQDKKRINFLKHFQEEPFQDEIHLPYKSARYVRKVQMRNTIRQIGLRDFITSDEFQKQDIWDLKYISTSDEEDNDSDIEDEDSEEEEDEEEAEESKKA